MNDCIKCGSTIRSTEAPLETQEGPLCEDCQSDMDPWIRLFDHYPGQQPSQTDNRNDRFRRIEGAKWRRHHLCARG